MRKIGKLVLLMMIIFTVAFMFTNKVNAADELDYSGYEEIEGDDAPTTPETPAPTEENKTTDEQPAQNNTPTPEPEKTSEPEKTPEPAKSETVEPAKNESDTSTSNHIQAGSFVTVAYIVTGILAVSAITLGYVKFKKYNF